MPYFLMGLLIIVLAIGGHFLFPLVGAAVAISAGLWAVIITSVALFGIAIILLFVFSGIGIVIVGILSFVLAITAIVLFPVLFPILLPLLILLAFVGYMRRKQNP